MAVGTYVGHLLIGTGGIGTQYMATALPSKPQLVLLFWNGRSEVVDTALGGDHSRGVGAFTGPTARWANVTFAENNSNAASPDHWSVQATDCCVASTLGSAAQTTAGRADVLDISDSSFTLIIDEQFAQPLQVLFLSVWGLDGFKVGEITEPGSAGDQDTTGIGFKPDAGMFCSISSSGINTTESVLSLGFAASDSPSNMVWSGGGDGQANPSQTVSYCRSGECIALFGTAVTSIGARAAVTQWLDDGFRLNWVERAGSRKIAYAVWRGGRMRISNFTTSTTIDTVVVHGNLGLTPSAGIVLSSCRPESVADTPEDGDVWSLGLFGGPVLQQRTVGLRERDDENPTVVGTALEFDSIYVNTQGGGGTQGTVSVQFSGSNGVLFTQTEADIAENFVGYLVVGDGQHITLENPLVVHPRYVNSTSLPGTKTPYTYTLR